MEENNKHIDDLYREELGAYHEAPRDIVWDRIENNLDKIATRKRGNYNFLNRRLLFLTLGLALISSATYVSYTLSKKKADNSIANSETRQKANNTQELNTVIKTPANPGNVINDAKQGDETTPSEKSNKANHIPIQNITTKKSSEKQNNLEAGSAIKKEIVESSPKKNSVDNKLTAVTSSNISSPTERNINRGVLAPDNITANKDSRTSNADFKTIHHSSTITNIVSDNNSSIPMLSKRAPVNFNAYTNENQKTLNQEYKTPSPLPSINGSAQQSINNSTGAINALTPNAINKQEITSETISGKSNTTQELQATNKRTQSAVETTSGDNQPLLITDNTKEKKKPGIQIGTKIGLEMGFGNYASDKITGAAYASLNLSDKLCLMIQPGIKIARLNQTIDYGTKPYIANGTKAYNDTLEAYGATHAQDLYYFHYYQVYDSIAARRKTTTSYIGFETPILLKYAVSKRISLLGGLTLDMSRIIAVNETVVSSQQYQTSPSSRYDLETQSEFNARLDTAHFSHPSPYYTKLQQANGNPIRWGYMLGIDYNIKERIFLELMMTQTISSQTYIPDANVRNLYTQPYFRFSVGYRLGNIFNNKPSFINTTK